MSVPTSSRPVGVSRITGITRITRITVIIVTSNDATASYRLLSMTANNTDRERLDLQPAVERSCHIIPTGSFVLSIITSKLSGQVKPVFHFSYQELIYTLSTKKMISPTLFLKHQPYTILICMYSSFLSSVHILRKDSQSIMLQCKL